MLMFCVLSLKLMYYVWYVNYVNLFKYFLRVFFRNKGCMFIKLDYYIDLELRVSKIVV